MKTYIKQKHLKTGELHYLAIEPIIDEIPLKIEGIIYALHPHIADKSFIYSTIKEEEFAAVPNPTSFTIPVYYNKLSDKVLSGHYIVNYLTFFKDCIIFVNDNMDPIASEDAENLFRLAYAQYQLNQIKEKQCIHPDKTIGWNTEMSYGKYSGKKLIEVLKEDPEYLVWTMDNTGSRYATFLKEHHKEIDDAIYHKDPIKNMWLTYFGH